MKIIYYLFNKKIKQTFFLKSLRLKGFHKNLCSALYKNAYFNETALKYNWKFAGRVITGYIWKNITAKKIITFRCKFLN